MYLVAWVNCLPFAPGSKIISNHTTVYLGTISDWMYVGGTAVRHTPYNGNMGYIYICMYECIAMHRERNMMSAKHVHKMTGVYKMKVLQWDHGTLCIEAIGKCIYNIMQDLVPLIGYLCTSCSIRRTGTGAIYIGIQPYPIYKYKYKNKQIVCFLFRVM